MTTASADRDLIADGLLTVQEALDFTKLGRTDLYARMNSGELRSVKIGRRRLIPKRALIDLISRNLVKEESTQGEEG
jgi:excisionase family DNA binding protein